MMINRWMNREEARAGVLPEVWRGLPVQYFKFEEDFVEDGIRCIPMIVRYKLDAVGIKLKLKEWSRFNSQERMKLASDSVDSIDDIIRYREHLSSLVKLRTGEDATRLADYRIGSLDHEWNMTGDIPACIKLQLAIFGCRLTLQEWRGLSTLQRFALIKLSRPGHENRIFPRAIAEFVNK